MPREYRPLDEAEKARIAHGMRRRLALRLSRELPGLDPERLALCAAPEYDDGAIAALASEIKAWMERSRSPREPSAPPEAFRPSDPKILRQIGKRKKTRIIRKGHEFS